MRWSLIAPLNKAFVNITEQFVVCFGLFKHPVYHGMFLPPYSVCLVFAVLLHVFNCKHNIMLSLIIPKLNPASGTEHGLYSDHKCHYEIYRAGNLPLFRGFPLMLKQKVSDLNQYMKPCSHP